MVTVYLRVLNVVSIPTGKSESVVCTTGQLFSPLPCPKGPDPSPALRNRAAAAVPSKSLHPDLRDRHHHKGSYNSVFFKPCREPESSGRSSSSRALRFLSRPVGVVAVVAEPLTPPGVGPRTDADKTFCAISTICQALCPLVLD